MMLPTDDAELEAELNAALEPEVAAAADAAEATVPAAVDEAASLLPAAPEEAPPMPPTEGEVHPEDAEKISTVELG